MRPGNLPFSPSINSAFGWETVRCLPSTFCATGRPSFKFLLLRGTFRQLPSTFHVGRKHFVHFLQLSLLLGDLLSTSVIISCRGETFCQLWSTFCAAWRPSVHFCQLSMRLEDSVKFLCNRETFRRNQWTFNTPGRPSIKFHQLSVRLGIFLELRSTFQVAGRPFVNFACGRENFL